MDTKTHYSSIRRVLIYVFVLNIVVALAKIIYGMISRCSSMSADGFHSLSDASSNIIGLIGIRLACQPTDSDHPYGHKKYETLFSLGIAVGLFFVCFNLIKEGVHHFYYPEIPQVDVRSFAVMLFTMAINFLVVKYETAKGRSLQSDILLSDALHTTTDILVSVSVIITLVAVKVGFPILDPIATIAIAILIAHAAIEILREASRVLCDTAIIDPKKITDVVLSVKGVKTCHKVRTRGRPDDIHVDLHVQVNPDMHIDHAHKISYQIEQALKKSLPEITDVLVHMEPKEKDR